MKILSKHKTLLVITTAGILVVIVGIQVVGAGKRDKLYRRLLQAITLLAKQGDGDLAVEQAFDPNYLDTLRRHVKTTIITLKKEAALDYARQLHKAWKPWYQGGDDEDLAYSVFRRLKDKVQLSQLAAAYAQAYEHSLIETLKRQLSKKEIKKVMAIVAPLPAYRTP